MTEDEAKTKWCPQAHDGSNQKCIGSKCMAWRWRYNNRDLIKDRPEEFKGLKDVGYCGLAGKPS